MEAALAWLFVIVFWLLPLAHVTLSPRSGPWRPPAGTRCPFGPRAGWTVMVLLLGAVGWLLYYRARWRPRGQPDRA